MQIRIYRGSDRESLIALWRTVFPDDPPHNDPAAMIDAKRAVDDMIFVAETESGIVGACMAGYDGHRGWLYALGVLEDYRGQGIGAGLVEHSLRALKQRGCIKVNLQVRASNRAVERFYRSLGFDTEARISMGRFI